MREFKKIAVVGSGTMGHGIAQTFASFGFETVVIDVKAEALETAKKLVAANVQIMRDMDFITEEQADNTAKYLSYSDSYEAARDADLVIEAVPEVKAIKASVFANLDKVCRPDTILASTTSAMNVFSAVKVSHPERVLITHFNNPSHIVPLVEIVCNKHTTPDLVQDMRDLLVGIGKSPAVMTKYVPGFIVNRLTAALLREASNMVEKGWVTMEDVDTAFSCNQGLKAPFEGPLELMDYIGWDVANRVGRILYPFLSSKKTPSRLAKQMIKEGKLGVKSGKGFKDYTGKERAELQAKRNEGVIKILNVTKEIKNNK